MFRRSKGGEGGNPADGEAGADDIQAPPIKPFSKKGAHAPNKPSFAAALRPSVTRPSLDIPGATRRTGRGRAGQSESNKLTVGRDIHLKGEITSCHKLVVEGKVEAALADPGAVVLNSLTAEQHAGGGQRYGRPGRIAGSVVVPSRDLVDPATGAMLPMSAVRQKFADVGALEAERVVTYCGGGIDRG